MLCSCVWVGMSAACTAVRPICNPLRPQERVLECEVGRQLANYSVPIPLLCYSHCQNSRIHEHVTNISHWICWSLSPWMLYDARLNPSPPNSHYIGRTAPLTYRRCILNIFFKKISVLNILKCCIISVFLYSKCRLFHNATLFGVCVIRILNAGCAKI
jgi:hypothetical protein